MKRTKKKYSGVLSRPSRPRPESVVGDAVFQKTEAEAEQARWRNAANLGVHEMKGLDHLCQHYQISDEDAALRFMKLSICLARDHVPYFWSRPGKPGPKKAFFRSALLLTDVELVKATGAKNDRAAILKLLKRKEWRSYDQDSLERMLRAARKNPKDPMAVITLKLALGRQGHRTNLSALRSWRALLSKKAE